MADEDGYVWYAGRADDVIISAGYRIGPFEVESACVEHPAVNDDAAAELFGATAASSTRFTNSPPAAERRTPPRFHRSPPAASMRSDVTRTKTTAKSRARSDRLVFALAREARRPVVPRGRKARSARARGTNPGNR